MTASILVGFDPVGADHAPIAFGVAAARLTGAPLIVAAVGAHGHDADDDLLAACSAALEQAGAEPDGAAVSCRALHGGKAAQVLQDEAAREQAGLLVVGSTTRSAARRTMLGSTGEHLMHGAPCPVAIVPHQHRTGGDLSVVGVAWTEGEEGQEVLRAGCALARLTHSSLRVLGVVHKNAGMVLDTEATHEDGTAHHANLEDVEGRHQLSIEAHVRAELKALDAEDVDAEIDAYVGDPADALMRVTEHLDLLVCGSRGHGHLRAVALGSVTRKLTAQSSCPVLVLPRGSRGVLDGLIAAGTA
jgi:nucleotide-binding universal stress UspA family protein